jgi:hypothetical protein
MLIYRKCTIPYMDLFCYHIIREFSALGGSAENKFGKHVCYKLVYLPPFINVFGGRRLDHPVQLFICFKMLWVLNANTF